MKDKNYKKALGTLEIVLLKQSSNYQGLLLTIKCYIEMDDCPKAKQFIEKAEEYHPNDINIKMASLTVAKKEGGDPNELLERYFGILQVLIPQKDAKKTVSILTSLYELVIDDLFVENKDRILKVSMEALEFLSEKEDCKVVNDFLQKEYELGKIDDLEFQELLEQQPEKLETSPAVREILEEKTLQKLENTLDKKELKEQLMKKKAISDTLRLYLFKYGAFDLQETITYLESLPSQKSPKQKKLLFLVNYLQEIFAEQKFSFEVQLLKEMTQLDLEEECFEYMEFILKIKELFEEQDSYQSLLVYFINNFKIHDMHWLRDLICFKLFQRIEFVEKNVSFLNQVLNSFLQIETEEFGKLFLQLLARYHNTLFKSSGFKLDPSMIQYKNSDIESVASFQISKMN